MIAKIARADRRYLFSMLAAGLFFGLWLSIITA